MGRLSCKLGIDCLVPTVTHNDTNGHCEVRSNLDDGKQKEDYTYVPLDCVTPTVVCNES